MPEMMDNLYNYCHVSERTDVGCRRKANEDWLAHFISPNGLVAVVCDGMGGHVGGQIASHTGVDAIKEFMMRPSDLSPQELIIEAINKGNEAILARAEREPELKGMGATCVMLLVRDGKVYIGSVGDSRVYLNRNHTLRQLTKDQSYVQSLVDDGFITKEEAEHHPRKNEITNAMGLQGMKPATVLPNPIDPQAGDCFLLCSDGLSGMVNDNEICMVISRQSDMSTQDRVDDLVLRARKNGGVDNITAQIVEFAITPGETVIPKWYENRNIKYGAIAAIALLVIIGAFFIFKPKTKANEEPITISKEFANMIESADEVYTLEPIAFKDKEKFLTIISSKEFESIRFIQHIAGKDVPLIVNEPLSLLNMTITPQELVKIKDTSDKNKTGEKSCELSFTGKYNNQREIGIMITGNGNAKYMFIIPLLTDKADDKTKTLPLDYGAIKLKIKDKASDIKIVGDDPEEEIIDNNTDTNNSELGDQDAQSETGSDSESSPDESSVGIDISQSGGKAYDITVKVDKNLYRIGINNSNDVDTNIDFDDCTIKGTEFAQPHGWCSVDNYTGNSIKILINKEKLPNNNTQLKVPATFTIDGVQYDSIIIRLKKK